MKIIMALQGLDIGGAETHVAELAKEIKRRGHNVIMISGGGVYQKEIEDFGIKHYTVPVKYRKIADMAKAKKMLKQILLKERPDIVHAHARIPAFLLGLLHKEMKKSFVYVTTAHWTFDTSFLLKRLTCWGDKTLCVSDDIKKYLLKNYNVDEKNIYISINGIDSGKFNKNVSGERIMKEFNLNPDIKRIVYVSRLNPAVCAPAYGLIEKAEKINSAAGGVEILIVGGGDCFDDMRKKAEAVNKKLGRRAVIMAGPRTDINELHATADVCVGVSRAILEPMLMEKKCVVAGQEGYIGVLTPEKLKEAMLCNFTCRGCKKLDFDVLADDVIKLLNADSETSKQITDYGKEVVDTYYSVKKMADDNLKMYSDALRDMRTEAAILGYYGYGNCGDDALLKAITDDMKSIDETFKPIVLSHTPQKTQAEYGVECINRFNISGIRKAFKRVKLLIVGGGSLLQDVTSTKSLLYYLSVIKMAKKEGIKVMLYANGIGPIIRKQNQKKAAKVLNEVDVITLRDEDSAKLLKTLGVTKPRIQITADPAFGLKKCSDERTAEILKKYGLKEKEYVCISVRDYVSDKYNIREDMAKTADYIAKKYSCIPVFVPMQGIRDTAVSKDVISKMGQNAVFVENTLKADELLGLLSKSRAIIAVRLHMLIFGALEKIPVLGIEYDPKIKSFQNYIGQLYTLTPQQLKDGSYKETVDSFLNNADTIQKELEKRLPQLKQKAFENAQTAIKLINGDDK